MTPSLQRQMSLYNRARGVEYFIYDELDRPFPVILEDLWTKIAFRTLRAQAIARPDRHGAEAMMEYLVKTMGQRYGSSRDSIVAQFEREYGSGIEEKLKKFQSINIANGYAEGLTFVEVTARGLGVTISKVSDRRAI